MATENAIASLVAVGISGYEDGSERVAMVTGGTRTEMSPEAAKQLAKQLLLAADFLEKSKPADPDWCFTGL